MRGGAYVVEHDAVASNKAISNADAAAAVAAATVTAATTAATLAVSSSSRTITPVALDMRLDDATLRRRSRAGLENTLTPMVALHHHGCSELLAELAARARVHHNLEGSTFPQQSAYDLDGPLEPLAFEARTKLTELCCRVLRIVVGSSPPIEGRLCLRAYKHGSGAGMGQNDEARDDVRGQRLGAHCDNTLLTLLWADGPGLQVLHPGLAPDWTPERIMNYGLPTMAGTDDAEELREDQWATVELPWSEGPLLLTLGCSWLSSIPTDRHPAVCAVLHRVVAPPCDRCSIPFLVDIKAESGTG